MAIVMVWPPSVSAHIDTSIPVHLALVTVVQCMFLHTYTSYSYTHIHTHIRTHAHTYTYTNIHTHMYPYYTCTRIADLRAYPLQPKSAILGTV